MICGEVFHDFFRRVESEKGMCVVTQKGYKYSGETEENLLSDDFLVPLW